MITFKSIPSIKKFIKNCIADNKSIGFIPTMGSLHEGHLSLIKKSRRENDVTIVSIFVNPTQFGLNEDFKEYPRQEKKDTVLLKQEEVDCVFCPTVKMMYPAGYSTYVFNNDLSSKLCGLKRPDHFQGVTTIVCKLLNIVQPTRLYLGQKDAQQAVIIKQMIKDLNLPVATQIGKIIREDDGLALSSRNNYLLPEERRAAPLIYQGLKETLKKFKAGEHTAKTLINNVKSILRKSKHLNIEYVQCVNINTLDPLETINQPALLAVAVHAGTTRLIDNVILK